MHAFQDNWDIVDLGVMRFDKYQCLECISPLPFVEKCYNLKMLLCMVCIKCTLTFSALGREK